jgi:hypothetical protein
MLIALFTTTIIAAAALGAAAVFLEKYGEQAHS